ncbi:MAG: Hint domain-containing protein [Thiohalocapsa sp.]|jgi:hypothetical protein|uniref:Hint domain-containing protein n=1 Tax=Thiohalocapsa sp. TaxID=2497641 RepID=UPI0025F80241|nr:Hint domain-containing protein [Thiohalocapsa sp.]MCG6942395.1 Hint domain-containing protein [Thiohalocapsa sp.]
MATWTYNFSATYAKSGFLAPWTVQSEGAASGALNAVGDNFDVGEVSVLPNGQNGIFLGSLVDASGTKLLMFLSGTTFYGYGHVPDGFSALDDFRVNNLSVSAVPVCFAAGTLIASPDGERAVETLKIGDLITTSDGRAVPVKWLGRQTLHKIFTPAERFVPVRVTAGALGGGLPHTDLVLTAEHALILDGLAINAGALVNGTTIAYEPVERLPDRVTYYHVETECHEVILANGGPAETYVDYAARRTFDNYDEYLDLYGEERTIAEMPLPRVSAARLVPAAIRARLGGVREAA